MSMGFNDDEGWPGRKMVNDYVKLIDFDEKICEVELSPNVPNTLKIPIAGFAENLFVSLSNDGFDVRIFYNHLSNDSMINVYRFKKAINSVTLQIDTYSPFHCMKIVFK